MKDGVHMGIFNFLFDTLKNDMKETYVLHDLLKPEETNEKPLLRDIQDFTYKKRGMHKYSKSLKRGQRMWRGFTPYDFWLLKWCVFSLSSSSCTFKFSFASFFISSLHVPGKHDSSSDGSGGVCRVHLQGFWKQCSGCVPHHHLGVSATAAQAAAKTQQLPQRPETSLATAPSTSAGSDWANRPGPGHEEGPGQELCAHVETYHYKYIYIYV